MSDFSLVERLDMAAVSLRAAVRGSDEDAEPAPWFRVAYLREVAADLDAAIRELNRLDPEGARLPAYVLRRVSPPGGAR